MNFGERTQNDVKSGKRVSGFQTQKDNGFSLGWDTNNQLNKKQLASRKQVTDKVTSSQNIQAKGPENFGQEKITPSALEAEYQRIIRANPNISEEELDTLLLKFTKSEQLKAVQKESDRNSKQPEVQERTVSRKNNSNLVLGDGYNYFKDNKK